MAITKDTFTVIAFIAWKHTGPQVTISFEVNVSSIRMGIDQDDMPSKALEAWRCWEAKGELLVVRLIGASVTEAGRGRAAPIVDSWPRAGRALSNMLGGLESQPEGHACTLVASNAGPETVFSASL